MSVGNWVFPLHFAIKCVEYHLRFQEVLRAVVPFPDRGRFKANNSVYSGGKIQIIKINDGLSVNKEMFRLVLTPSS